MNTKPFKREVSCFLVPRQKVLSFTTDNVGGAVEFDFPCIWEQLKKMEYRHVCMIHSHPDGCYEMSDIDRNMVYGWVLALGVPIYFCILCDSNVTCYRCELHKEGSEKPKVIRRIVPFQSNQSFDEIIKVVDVLSRSEKLLSEVEMNVPILLCNEIYQKPNIVEKSLNKNYRTGNYVEPSVPSYWE